jgi:putative YhdH/YhfP family quinone oxidoreductase
MTTQTFRRFEVDRQTDGQIVTRVAEQALTALAPGEVRIRVAWSSLNYKDALAASGSPAVIRQFPAVPGIDAAGEVLESRSPRFSPGDEVLATSYDLGVTRPGGWAEVLDAPADWIVPLPPGLTPREAMLLGTAGLTAGLCVAALLAHEVAPDQGDVLVTGASGGVGSLALRLLAQLGFRVMASSGKKSLHETLLRWGAAEVLTRDGVRDESEKPLLAARWAGVVDCVGGRTLATAIRQTRPGGCIAACGLTGGPELPLTVMPFILRGVTLAGIDSAYCPYERRARIWKLLASDWKLAALDEHVTEARLEDLDSLVAKMLHGQSSGRVIVQPGQK